MTEMELMFQGHDQEIRSFVRNLLMNEEENLFLSACYKTRNTGTWNCGTWNTGRTLEEHQNTGETIGIPRNQFVVFNP